MKYSEQDMAALISEVEAQFSEHLAKTESNEDTNKTEAVEAKIEKSEPKVEVEAEKTNETQNGFDYDDEDYQEMDKMYLSMTKSEAEAHYQSVKKTLFGEVEETSEAPAAEVKIEKSENSAEVKIEAKIETKAKENDIQKSLEEEKTKNVKLEKSFQELLGKLTSFVKKGKTAPEQKAVTQIEYIAKTEEEKTIEKNEKEKVDVSKLKPAEVTARLNEKVRSGDLKKSDRESINDFYLGEKAGDIESIKHLL